MSHAPRADKLLIKPAAGARPAPPHTRGQFIRKARTQRPVTRRVTRGTTTTRLATTPDRPTQRVLPSPEGRVEITGDLVKLAGVDRHGTASHPKMAVVPERDRDSDMAKAVVFTRKRECTLVRSPAPLAFPAVPVLG